MRKQSVLFVCTGNICRSPTAEGVLRHKLRALGLDKAVAVASAGTVGYHAGEPPDGRAIRHARARGYDISRQRARPLSRGDLQRHDWVIAMDHGHLLALRDMAPKGGGARVEPMMSFARHHPGVTEVPDPYFGAAAGFDRVLDLLEDACDGFVDVLRGQGTSAPKA